MKTPKTNKRVPNSSCRFLGDGNGKNESENETLKYLAGFLDMLIQIDLNNREEQVKK